MRTIQEIILLKNNLCINTNKGKYFLEKGEGIKIDLKKNSFIEVDTKNIKVKNPGVLDIPEDKNFWDMPLNHFIDLAKTKGKKEVMAALLNLERWNKTKEPSISKKAREIINSLKKNKNWINIKEKRMRNIKEYIKYSIDSIEDAKTFVYNLGVTDWEWEGRASLNGFITYVYKNYNIIDEDENNEILRNYLISVGEAPEYYSIKEKRIRNIKENTIYDRTWIIAYEGVEIYENFYIPVDRHIILDNYSMNLKNEYDDFDDIIKDIGKYFRMDNLERKDFWIKVAGDSAILVTDVLIDGNNQVVTEKDKIYNDWREGYAVLYTANVQVELSMQVKQSVDAEDYAELGIYPN